MDGSGAAAPLVLSKAPTYEAVMTPDGAAVVYQSDTASSDLEYRMLAGDTTRKPIAATLTTAPQLGVASRSELFDDVFLPATSPHANYDVSPDGSHLLFLAGVDDQRLMVVYNWAAESRTRIGMSSGSDGR